MYQSPQSSAAAGKPVTVPAFRNRKGETPLTMLTAYDFLWASLFDEAGVDSILVGDSMAMVVHGRDATVGVTLDQIIYHTEMVARAAKRALVIADMPFLSYQTSPADAIANAGRILKETQASAVKIEGGVHLAPTIERLVQVGIPVLGHVGLMPQNVRALGGMKIARDEDQVLADAKAVEAAGAFGMVLELVPSEIAARVTEEVAIPTIGIGAGNACDGQVLVGPDMLGLSSGFHPRFLKHFGNLKSAVSEATADFLQAVQTRDYPGPEHSYQ